jgi:hypothetical protein
MTMEQFLIGVPELDRQLGLIIELREVIGGKTVP